MRLSALPLKNFQNINSFKVASEWTIRTGESNTLYFQIVDADQENLRQMLAPAEISVTVIFPAVNPANIVTKQAVQVSAQDSSIWQISLLETERPSSGNVQFEISVDGSVKRFSVLQALVVEMFNQGGC